MTGIALSQDDIFGRARELRAAGVPLPEIERYLQSKMGTGGTPLSRALRRHDAPGVAKIVSRQNLNEQEATEGPSYVSQATGGVASLLRNTPVEALQVLTRSAASGDVAAVKRLLGDKDAQGQSYSEAFSDIRGGEETAHPVVRHGNSIIGGVVAGSALPGSLPVQGALYGAATGALQADPDADLADRAIDATVGGVVGAAAGALPAVGRWVGGRAGLGVDIGLAAVGRPGRLVRRGAAALADATKTTSPPPVQPAPHAPSVPGFQPNEPPVTSALTEPRRLMSRPRSALPTELVNLARPAPATTGPTVSPRDEARLRLQELLQRNIEDVTPVDPPTDWDLMDRLERLLNPRDRVVPLIRPQP